MYEAEAVKCEFRRELSQKVALEERLDTARDDKRLVQPKLAHEGGEESKSLTGGERLEVRDEVMRLHRSEEF
jgi:hypothetical protein